MSKGALSPPKNDIYDLKRYARMKFLNQKLYSNLVMLAGLASTMKPPRIKNMLKIIELELYNLVFELALSMAFAPMCIVSSKRQEVLYVEVIFK